MEKYQNIMKHTEYWKERIHSENVEDQIDKIEQTRRLYDAIYETAVRVEDLWIEVDRLRHENRQLQKRIEEMESKVSEIDAEVDRNE